jgi:hypothetical protein
MATCHHGQLTPHAASPPSHSLVECVGLRPCERRSIGGRVDRGHAWVRAHPDRRLGPVGRPGLVDDGEPDGPSADGVVGRGGGRAGSVELPVAVEVPAVGQLVAGIRVERHPGIERHGQRRVTDGRRGRERGVRRRVGGRVADPVNGTALRARHVATDPRRSAAPPIPHLRPPCPGREVSGRRSTDAGTCRGIGGHDHQSRGRNRLTTAERSACSAHAPLTSTRERGSAPRRPARLRPGHPLACAGARR